MKTIKKIFEIEASLDEVFEAMTDMDIIEQWTGSIAEFDAQPNGKFSMWDDEIVGRNVEISKEKIVQKWKAVDWEKYSLVTFTFQENDGVTTINVKHQEVPATNFTSVSEGWENQFYKPLKDLLEEGIEFSS
jgi:activator of HSP90 ATPase